LPIFTLVPRLKVHCSHFPGHKVEFVAVLSSPCCIIQLLLDG
jgi:hypothetical protein